MVASEKGTVADMEMVANDDNESSSDLDYHPNSTVDINLTFSMVLNLIEPTSLCKTWACPVTGYVIFQWFRCMFLSNFHFAQMNYPVSRYNNIYLQVHIIKLPHLYLYLNLPLQYNQENIKSLKEKAINYGKGTNLSY